MRKATRLIPFILLMFLSHDSGIVHPTQITKVDEVYGCTPPKIFEIVEGRESCRTEDK